MTKETKKTTLKAAPETPSPTPAPAAPEAPAQATSSPEKRGRGRPRKDGAAAPVSPSEASAASTGPGRPKSSAKKKGKISFDGDSLATLAKQVQGLHQLVALATGIPELQLREEEAQMLGGAIAAVCEEYDLSLSGKTGAMLQLAAAAAMVYAPRFAIVTQRVKQQQAAARQKADLRVVGGTDGTQAPNA